MEREKLCPDCPHPTTVHHPVSGCIPEPDGFCACKITKFYIDPQGVVFAIRNPNREPTIEPEPEPVPNLWEIVAQSYPAESIAEGRRLILEAARDQLARITLDEYASDANLRELVRVVARLASDLAPANPGPPDPVFCGACGDWRPAGHDVHHDGIVS